MKQVLQIFLNIKKHLFDFIHLKIHWKIRQYRMMKGHLK